MVCLWLPNTFKGGILKIKFYFLYQSYFQYSLGTNQKLALNVIKIISLYTTKILQQLIYYKTDQVKDIYIQIKNEKNTLCILLFIIVLTSS